MSRFTIYAWFLGVPEARGGVAAPLYGLPMRSIILAAAINSRVFDASKSSSPDSWCCVPQPSWATTKETAAWRFGA